MTRTPTSCTASKPKYTGLLPGNSLSRWHLWRNYAVLRAVISQELIQGTKFLPGTALWAMYELVCTQLKRQQ